MAEELLGTAPLGKKSQYPEHYDASLLFPIPRFANRQKLGLAQESPLPFSGDDVWNAYECSWLSAKGIPRIAIAQITIPSHSKNLIESKSLKLYLNSYNNTQFEAPVNVSTRLVDDLSEAAGCEVGVKLLFPKDFNHLPLRTPEGECLDNLDVDLPHYSYDAEVLTTGETTVQEVLYSDLLKSNCPVTGQPDWATVHIHYHGKQIDKKSLLRYLVAFRHHQELHEMCVERIFCDIKRTCAPEKLSVYARYTRRGGIDINPFRSDFEDTPPFERLARQ